MVDLAKLVVKLEAQSAQLTAELQRAKKQLTRFDDDVARTAKRIGIGVAAAATAAASGIGLMVRNSIDSADELSKLSQKVGIATDDLSKLQYAAGLSGVESGSLQTALQRLSQSAVDAGQGTGEAAKAFNLLGVSAKNIDGALKGNQELLLELSDAFSRLPDGPTKTAAAIDILGRSGADLIPLLNSGAQGIRDMGTELQQLGGVVTPEAGRQAELFNDNLSRLQLAAFGVGNQIAAGLVPDMNRLTGLLVDTAKNTNGASRAADALSLVLRTATFSALGFGNVLQIAGEGLAAFTAAQWMLLKGEPSRALEVLKEGASDFAGNVEDIQRAYEALFTSIDARKAEDAFDSGYASDLQRRLLADESSSRAAIEQWRGSLDRWRGGNADTGIDKALRDRDALSASLESEANIRRELERLQERESDLMAEAGQLYDQTRTPLEQFNAQLARLDVLRNTIVDGGPLIDGDLYARGIAQAQERLESMTTSVRKLQKQGKETNDALSVYAEEASKRMQNAFADFLFDPFKDGVDGMVRNFADALQRMAADKAAAEVFDFLEQKVDWGNVFGTIASGAASLFGGIPGVSSTPSEVMRFPGEPRAMGGPISSGDLYMVGERGPELFVSDRSGSIVPNHELGGRAPNITINVPIHAPRGSISEPTRMQVAASVGREVQRALARNG